jgi:hypothetical protein
MRAHPRREEKNGTLSAAVVDRSADPDPVFDLDLRRAALSEVRDPLA